MDRYASLRQRQRNPSGADSELERTPVAGKLGQEIEYRLDDLRSGLVIVGLVVSGRDPLVEISVVRHGGYGSTARNDRSGESTIGAVHDCHAVGVSRSVTSSDARSAASIGPPSASGAR